MYQLFRTTLLIPFCVMLCSGVSLAAESAASPKRIFIAYSGISPSQAPAWIAYEHGFFRKYGLDVQLLFVEGGTRTVQTLVSGDVVAAQVAGSSVIQSNLQGSGIVMIAGFLNTMDYKFVASREITRPDQLKGKAVAVSRIGSSSDFATRYALEKYGLEPDKDVAILQIGSQPARFAAMESGKIHAVMIAIPLTAKASKMGFNTLADLQMLGLEYQHTGLAVSQKLIKSQPEMVRNILRACVEAIHYMKTHRKESLAVLAKYLKTDEPEALEEAYDAIGLTLMPSKPYPTIKGIQIMLREMGVKDPVARNARPEQFVDLSFIQELDNSGFIDRLYKSTAIAKSTSGSESTATAPAAKPARSERSAPSLLAEAKAKSAAAASDKAQVTPASLKPAREPSSRHAPAAQQYVVKAGDTLSKLSDRFYNSISKWEKIYEANRDSVKNPNYIYIGQKLIIPADDEAS